MRKTVSVMRKWLKTVPTMIRRKALSILFLVFHTIISFFGLLMLWNGLWIHRYLWDYMNMSVQGSGADTLDTPMRALVSVGSVLGIITLFGVYCTIRGHRAHVLYLYGAFLAGMLLLALGISVTLFYTYRTNIYEGFDQGLNETMAAYGQHNSKSILIDTIQATLQCCGNRGYTDWHNFDPPKNIPWSCCKMPEINCPIPQNLEDIYTKGCYNLVLDFISQSIFLVAGTAICITLLPFGICFSWYLASKQVEQVVRCMTYQKTTPTVLSSVYRIGAQGHSIRIMKNTLKKCRDELIWAMPQIMVGPVSTNTV